ncbi:hypothetical protein [Pontibaca methylaminivorans]|uniref:hypothetical protein n=1 Tax=Pontibaca methylaminivorans TaxID=515897 RepID=UPI002FDA36AE
MIHPSHALTHPIRAFLLAGAGAAVLTIAVLGALSAATGAPWWAPLNATTHVFHGGEAAQVTAADWRHTGVGTIIHVLSCFFWALVALIILLLLRRGIGRGLPMPWLAAGLTVLLAALGTGAEHPRRRRRFCRARGRVHAGSAGRGAPGRARNTPRRRP